MKLQNRQNIATFTKFDNILCGQTLEDDNQQ